MSDFTFFWKDSPFSQWYKCKFTANSIFNDQTDKLIYTSCEQYMMAEKARLFKDFDILDKILHTNSPKKQKDLGKQVRGFKLNKWNKYKQQIVYNGNLFKFEQNSNLKLALLNTGNKIIAEASPNDNIWGIGMNVNNPDINNPDKWKGQNLLGNILMKVREKLTNMQDTSTNSPSHLNTWISGLEKYKQDILNIPPELVDEIDDYFDNGEDIFNKYNHNIHEFKSMLEKLYYSPESIDYIIKISFRID